MLREIWVIDRNFAQLLQIWLWRFLLLLLMLMSLLSKRLLFHLLVLWSERNGNLCLWRDNSWFWRFLRRFACFVHGSLRILLGSFLRFQVELVSVIGRVSCFGSGLYIQIYDMCVYICRFMCVCVWKLIVCFLFITHTHICICICETNRLFSIRFPLL